MFFYTQNDGDMCISTNKGENKCQNNLSQFYGKNFNSIIIDGNNKSEFVLRSYKSNIDKIEIRNCVINLDEAMGYFQYVTFYYCKFYGNLNDKFHAIALDFTGGLKLSSLSGGNIEIINIKCSSEKNTINQVDFDGTEQMNNLNSLTLNYCYADLSKFKGTWKKVELINCNLRQQLPCAFKSEYMKIESRDRYVLHAFTDYHFNHITLNFRSYVIFDPLQLQLILWKKLDLVLEQCVIDLQQLCGKFNIFEAKSCRLKNSLTSQFSCDQIRLIECGLESQPYYTKIAYRTNVIYQIKCNSIYIQGNAVVDHLPNVKELSLKSCKVALKNQIINLEKLTLVECELQNLGASQVPSLKELHNYIFSVQNVRPDIQKSLLNIIQMNKLTQRRKDKQVKDIETSLKKRDRIIERIKNVNCEIQFCMWLIENNYYKGYE
ncbi:Hypothetical_protein [Hexamita inflata]|uniref:Hypothetical_protein n=1 Tax=Hexamita inflata TaxID=28002 RepID=A0AA86PVZ3_9EUKA|nr:Hypothetical protein HINF_LOCUS33673 [Hexamita inflata]CAI9967868.1 Hypothetical protein HINF_LOCUS55513 [Hexamita inflata]